jgi:hypothetical protein
MNKVVKIVLIILIIDVVAIGGYFGFKAISRGKSRGPAFEWTRIDESYYPQDYIEEFIKSDSAQRGLLPVFIRNYGKDQKALKKFKGKNFAGPTETQIKLKYRGLEDWQLIDLKYTAETEREVRRAILYVQEDGVWKVGDSGMLRN